LQPSKRTQRGRKISRLQALDELIQRWITEAKLQSRPTPSAVKVSDSPLSKEIQKCEFPKKFSTLTFNYYSRVSDPVQYIRHFPDKMVIYSRNDPIMCLTFLFNLKGAASDWCYFLPPHSLHNFEEVTETFLTQYASRQEDKKNSHHLFSVKMR